MDLGKQQLDQQSAVQMASKLDTAFTQLHSFLEAYQQDTDLALDKLTGLADKCKNARAVCLALASSDQHAQVKGRIEDGLAKVAKFLEESGWGNALDMSNFLRSLFRRDHETSQELSVQLILDGSTVQNMKLVIGEGVVRSSKLRLGLSRQNPVER